MSERDDEDKKPERPEAVRRVWLAGGRVHRATFTRQHNTWPWFGASDDGRWGGGDTLEEAMDDLGTTVMVYQDEHGNAVMTAEAA